MSCWEVLVDVLMILLAYLFASCVPRMKEPTPQFSIDQLEHEMLDGPFQHEDCRWCRMALAHAAVHNSAH